MTHRGCINRVLVCIAERIVFLPAIIESVDGFVHVRFVSFDVRNAYVILDPDGVNEYHAHLWIEFPHELAHHYSYFSKCFKRGNGLAT